VKIDYESEAGQRWIKVESDDFTNRPNGYYLYDETEQWCYGPFATEAECKSTGRRLGFDLQSKMS
jgi:hypothetical protein